MDSAPPRPGAGDGLSPSSPARLSGPVKHSVTIAGHRTSISLEPLFWEALRRAAREEGISLDALVARIDEERIAALAPARAGGADVRRGDLPAPPAAPDAHGGAALAPGSPAPPGRAGAPVETARNPSPFTPPNLASALRCWLWRRYCE